MRKAQKVQKLIVEKIQQQRLFTPGPLNITMAVKQTMLVDYGSRDPTFLEKLRYIRSQLKVVAGANSDEYTAVLLQGSGTYGIEATLNTCVHKEKDKVLVVTNGSYGERQIDILKKMQKRFTHLGFEDNQQVKPEAVIQALEADPTITHVSMVHSETTSGMINPIDFLKDYQRPVHKIIDAMSSFGAYRVDQHENNLDFVISSSNKCLQGPPGFCFVIAKKSALNKYKDNSTSLVLDLWDQDDTLNKSNQFRFTPPTHVITAFHKALQEHQEEGGVDARHEKYKLNQTMIHIRMLQLGFKPYLPEEYQGIIITTYHEPKNIVYNFQRMYDFLAQANIIIYPGKKTKAPTFRIGSIGDLNIDDINAMATRVRDYLRQNNIHLNH